MLEIEHARQTPSGCRHGVHACRSPVHALPVDAVRHPADTAAPAGHCAGSLLSSSLTHVAASLLNGGHHRGSSAVRAARMKIGALAGRQVGAGRRGPAGRAGGVRARAARGGHAGARAGRRHRRAGARLAALGARRTCTGKPVAASYGNVAPLYSRNFVFQDVLCAAPARQGPANGSAALQFLRRGACAREPGLGSIMPLSVTLPHTLQGTRRAGGAVRRRAGHRLVLRGARPHRGAGGRARRRGRGRARARPRGAHGRRGCQAAGRRAGAPHPLTSRMAAGASEDARVGTAARCRGGPGRTALRPARMGTGAAQAVQRIAASAGAWRAARSQGCWRAPVDVPAPGLHITLRPGPAHTGVRHQVHCSARTWAPCHHHVPLRPGPGSQVFAVDSVPERLDLARAFGATPLSLAGQAAAPAPAGAGAAQECGAAPAGRDADAPPDAPGESGDAGAPQPAAAHGHGHGVAPAGKGRAECSGHAGAAPNGEHAGAAHPDKPGGGAAEASDGRTPAGGTEARRAGGGPAGQGGHAAPCAPPGGPTCAAAGAAAGAGRRAPARGEGAGSGGAAPHSGEERVLAAVRGATGGRGADAVLEAVGSQRAMALAYQLIRPGGAVPRYGRPKA